MSTADESVRMSTPTEVFPLKSSEEYCQRVTRREAANFYWGFIALPKRQRVAIYALYSFSRQVDDAVDVGQNAAHGPDGPSSQAACARQRQRVVECYEGQPRDPVIRVLSEVVRDFKIPREELMALILGVEMDMENMRYQTWEELEFYCRHVASAVGRMTTRIFGFSDPVALTYADDLGTALQITNILRDVREDYRLGRVYLPQSDLARFQLDEAALAGGTSSPEWANLVRFEVDRAKTYFESGLRVTDCIPRRAAACVFTMAGMYQRILDQIERDPTLPLRCRTRVGNGAKVKVMVGAWLKAA
jgi:15-cis-phytoene synthase